MKVQTAVIATLGASLSLSCGSVRQEPPPEPERQAFVPEGDDRSGEMEPADDEDEDPGASAEDAPSAAFDPQDPEASYADAANAFAAELWRELRDREDPEQNLVVSPASVHIALSMVLGGARGNTEAELAAALGVREDQEAFHRAVGAALSAWNDPDRESYDLSVANRLFGEATYTFLEPFLELTEDVYGAPLEELDFRGEPEPARVRINEWVESATEDRIQDLLPPGSVDANTRLVLTNAVYFLGDWVHAFDPDHTQEQTFHAPEGELEVEMMHQQESFAYADVDGAALLEMPYEGEELSMVVALPEERGALEQVEDEVVAGGAEAWFEALREHEVNVALPPFEIDPPESLALSPVLERMGIRDAFSEADADLSGMADPAENEGLPLFLDDVYHKAFVLVDEEGTEAAAATGAVVGVTSAPAEPPEIVDFVADHPFLFFIRDRESGAILFMGRVTDPSA